MNIDHLFRQHMYVCNFWVTNKNSSTFVFHEGIITYIHYPSFLFCFQSVFRSTIVAYFTKEVNPCFAKQPLHFSGGEAKIGLTHWGRVTHICVSILTIIGSDIGLSPGRRQAIIWTNAGILLIWPLGINFIEILIEIQIFPFKKMHLKMSSAKWRLGLNVFTSLVRWAIWYQNAKYITHA